MGGFLFKRDSPKSDSHSSQGVDSEKSKKSQSVDNGSKRFTSGAQRKKNKIVSCKGNKKTEKNKSHSNGSLSVGKVPEPTKAEKEILRLITIEFLTPKQIARKRNCSKSIVHRLIKSLKKKGLINAAYQTTISEGKVNHPKNNNQNRKSMHGSQHGSKWDGTCEPSAQKERKKRKRKIVNHHRETVNHERAPQCDSRPIRLHGQQFSIGIIERDNRYRDRIGKTIFIDGNTVRYSMECRL